MLWGHHMMVLAGYTFTMAHQMALSKSQRRWDCGSPVLICSWKNVDGKNGPWNYVTLHFDFFRCSHQDPKKWLCLDILCLATWTWITISTLTWLWDLFLILSLFTGNFTATVQTLGDKEKEPISVCIVVLLFFSVKQVPISIKMLFLLLFPNIYLLLCFWNDLYVYSCIRPSWVSLFLEGLY